MYSWMSVLSVVCSQVYSSLARDLLWLCKSSPGTCHAGTRAIDMPDEAGALWLTLIHSSCCADKVGRKPVVVLANLIMGIATLGLGLAPTYWLAVMARCLGGAANGSGV